MIVGNPMMLGAAGDPFFGNVSLLVQPLAGASSYTTDATGKTLTYGGNAALSNTSMITGGNGISFDGTGDYVSTPDNAGFHLGSGDWTIEALINPSVVTGDRVIASKFVSGNTSASAWMLIISSGKLRFTACSGSSQDLDLQTTDSLTAGVDYYVAAKRSGNTVSVYFAFAGNGPWTASASYSNAINNGTQALGIGELYNGASGAAFNGTIYSVRVTKGVARTFARPTELWPTS